MNRTLTRRDFLKLAGAASAGLALSACGAGATQVPTPGSTAALLPPTGTPPPVPTPTATAIPSPTPVPNTLRGYADALGFRIGVVGEGYEPQEDTRSRLIGEHFNQMAITSIGWEVIGQGGENKYDFRIPDGLRRLASGYHMSTLGMHLVYGVDFPAWMDQGSFSRERLVEILQNHVRKVAGHYRGKVRAYTVVNEATEPSLFWNRAIGPEYVELACRAARESDPGAILIYNDYAHETAALPKAEQVYALARGLKEKDLIDAVGMQMHMIGSAYGSSNIDPRTPPTKEQLLEQMDRYSQLGLKVFITELDVDTSSLPGSLDEKLARQADIYSTVVQACLESEGICNDLNIWGFNDRETWLGEAALLFADNQPKPAYYAVLDVLRRFYTRTSR